MFSFLFLGCGSSTTTLENNSSVPSAHQSSSTAARSSHSAPLLRSADQLTADYKVTADWVSGFGADFIVTNNGTGAVQDWTVEFDYPYAINSIWNAEIVSHEGLRYTLKPATWSATLRPGASASIGWNGSPGNATVAPSNILFSMDSTPETPSPTPSPPTPEPSTTPTPSPTPEPEPPSVGAISVEYATTADWGSGFGGQITITNQSQEAISNWTLEFTTRATIDSIWNVTVHSRSGDVITVKPASWQANIPPGGSASFGFNGSPGGLAAAQSFRLFSNGQELALDGTEASPEPTPEEPPTPTPTPEPEPTPPPQSINGQKKVVAYFAEWGIYQRQYFVTDIPAEQLSAVIYAFADISANGEIALFDSWAAVDKSFPGDTWDQPLKGNFHQLKKLKQDHPHLKILIAIGGWTLSGRFSDVALTEQSRSKFALSVANFVQQYGFDGVDIDWEYPVGGGLGSNTYRPQDKQNFTLLLRRLREQLDALGQSEQKDYLLTAALPVGPDKIVNHELQAISEQLDWINLMTYDYHGGWESQTGHHAALHHNPQSNSDPTLNVESTVNAYLQAGVPSEKILLGIPAYGRSWSGTQGLFSTATGVPNGTYDNTGMFDYKDIMKRLRTEAATYQSYWDAVAKAPWVYAPTLSGGIFITYEDTQSLQEKLKVVKSLNLGGTMLWELSSDLSPNDIDSLIKQMSEGAK
jgi:GH18 family chitinase